jgi:hypothetical protein
MRFGVYASMAIALLIAACGSSDDSDTKGGNATRTPSGLAGELRLADLSEAELEQFCVAASTTLFSATTIDLECEIEAIVNEPAYAGLMTCDEAAAECAVSFAEIAELKCNSQIMEAAACEATVADGEECSFATAGLRGMLVPQVSCASDAEAKAAAVQAIYAANVFESIPECTRYLTCRRTL